MLATLGDLVLLKTQRLGISSAMFPAMEDAQEEVASVLNTHVPSMLGFESE